MTFYDKSRYDRLFQKVIHKEGESEMKYIKRFKNAQYLSVLVGTNYSGYQLMNILLNNSHQARKYTAQIASYQADLRRE